jgi:hypothetical protein
MERPEDLKSFGFFYYIYHMGKSDKIKRNLRDREIAHKAQEYFKSLVTKFLEFTLKQKDLSDRIVADTLIGYNNSWLQYHTKWKLSEESKDMFRSEMQLALDKMLELDKANPTLRISPAEEPAPDMIPEPNSNSKF